MCVHQITCIALLLPSLPFPSPPSQPSLGSNFLQEKGTILGFPKAEQTDENLLTAECDILIPAAGEQQITGEIAKELKAKVSTSRIAPAVLYM